MRSTKVLLASSLVACLGIATATVSASATNNVPGTNDDSSSEIVENTELANLLPEDLDDEQPQSGTPAGTSAPVADPNVPAEMPSTRSSGSVSVDNVADFIAAINGTVSEDVLTLTLTDGFFAEAATRTTKIDIKMPAGTVTVDGQGGIFTSLHTDRLLHISSGGNGSLTITNVVFDGQEKQPAIQMSAGAGTVTFDRVAMLNGTTSGNGAAMVIGSGQRNLHLIIKNSTVANNTVTGQGYTGGGFYSIAFEGRLDIANSEFFHNRSILTGTIVGGEGGAIFMYQMRATAQVTVINSLFQENEAAKDGLGANKSLADGGAIAIMDIVDGAKFIVDGNSFINNIAGDDGGAVLIQGVSGDNSGTGEIKQGNLVFQNNTFAGNIAQGLEGGADNGGAIQIYTNTGGRGTLKTHVDFINNTFYNNEVQGSSQTRGGAISASANASIFASARSVLHLKGNIFVDNKARVANSQNVGLVKGTLDDMGGNIGVDAGKTITYPTATEVFGTSTPGMDMLSNPHKAGVDEHDIPVLPLFPLSTALDGTTGDLGKDQRDFPRSKGVYDSGSVEIAFVKFLVNAPEGTDGKFHLGELASDDYSSYYDGVNPTEYYSVSHLVDGSTDQVNVTMPDNLGATIRGWKFLGWKHVPAAAPEETRAVLGEGDLLLPEAVIQTDQGSVYAAQWEKIGGTVSIDGTPKEGETLTAVPAEWPEDTEYEYQWTIGDSDSLEDATDIAGATGSTLVLTEEHAGKHIGVKLVAKHDTLAEDAGAVAAMVGPVLLPNGTVSVTGTPKEDETLTAVPTEWPEDTEYEYQWVISDTTDFADATDITGATGKTITLTGDQAGKYVGVKLVAKSDKLENGQGQANSQLVGPILDKKLPNGTVSITGTPKEDETLTAIPAGWPTGSSYQYQWVISDTTDFADATDITGATGKTITLTGDQAGKYIGVTLVAKNDKLENGQGQANSQLVGPILDKKLPNGTVSITGTPKEGETLTAVPTGWPTGSSYQYQWVISDTTDFADATDITGATGKTITLTGDQAGKYVGVKLVAKSDKLENGQGQANSQLVGPILDKKLPNGTVSITGTPKEDETLTAIPAGWPTGSSYQYQWVISDTTDFADATDITGATGKTITLTGDQAGKYIGVTLVAKNDKLENGQGQANSTMVGPVAPALEHKKPQLPHATVVINGKTETRQVLTPSVTGWPEGTELTYQWVYSATNDPKKATPIAGATNPTFTLGAEQMGGWVGLVVTGTHGDYLAPATATAALRGPVTPIVTRIGGKSRFDTAALMHERFSPKSGGTMFIATGMLFPDALTVAPAASKLNASLILTNAKNLNASAKSAILRQKPDRVVIVGQTAAVSKSTQKEIETLVGANKVSRIGGKDRYETSQEVFDRYFSDGTAKSVYVATGADYADALAAAPAATFENGGVLLVRGKSVTHATVKAAASIKAQNITNVKITGGTGAISNTVMNKIKEMSPSAVRVGGLDRYETTAKINTVFPSTTEYVWMASGADFADAFIGAVPAGIYGSPVFLTRPKCVPEVTGTAISKLKFAERIVVGGKVAVSDNALALNLCK